MDKNDITNPLISDITNPLISDIEELVPKFSRYFEKKSKDNCSHGSSVQIFDDQNIIGFVTDITLYEDENRTLIKYSDRKEFEQRNSIVRKKYHCNPKKVVLYQYYRHLTETNFLPQNIHLEKFLRLKSARSHSGVLVVTVLTSPGNFSCPKNCHYCPDQRDENGVQIMPRSYLDSEPACKRAMENKFDAFSQFFDRCYQLYKIGHVVDKIEIIVLGGTWSFYPSDYQEEFCRDLFYAANMFYDLLESQGDLSQMRKRKSIIEEQNINETSKCRIIGLTLETRPDYITKTELKKMRLYGCTRVQLGVQHTDNVILEKINRECTIERAIEATKMLKENCFKVDWHLMPDLPGSSPEIDRQMFQYVFNSSNCQPDYMKVYPTTITPFTEIEKWYKNGTYKPYAERNGGRELIELIKDIMVHCPPWTRLNRIYRDFPNQTEDEVGAIGGIMLTNLRQIVQKELNENNLYSKDIRSSEVKTAEFSWKSAQLFVRTYRASDGIEHFISIESSGVRDNTFPGNYSHDLYGLIRLRFMDKNYPKRKRLDPLNEEGVALIRELHVYGSLVKVEETRERASQHFGIGKRLLEKAEQMAREAGYTKTVVIAGVGTRGYYRKLGYEDYQNFYMLKDITTKEPQNDETDETIKTQAQLLREPGVDSRTQLVMLFVAIFVSILSYLQIIQINLNFG